MSILSESIFVILIFRFKIKTTISFTIGTSHNFVRYWYNIKALEVFRPLSPTAFYLGLCTSVSVDSSCHKSCFLFITGFSVGLIILIWKVGSSLEAWAI